MKQKIAVAVCLLLSVYVWAQEAKPAESPAAVNYKHEFGLNLFSVTNMDISGGTSLHATPENAYHLMSINAPSGAYYKLHSGKNALRLSYDFFLKSYTENEYTDLSYLVYADPAYPSGYTYTYTGKKQDHEFKIGYQRSIGKKRLTGFFSADLIAGYSKLTGTNEFNWHPMETINSSPFYYEQYRAGIALGGGLRYEITKRLSLSYEISLAGIYTRTRNLAYKDSESKTDLSLKLSPVRMIGIGFLF